VVSVCNTWFKTENSGFCTQIVFTVDLLSFSRKNKMRGSRSEGHIRDARNTRMGERSRRQRRLRASSEEDQGPEGNVDGWMDGWMCGWVDGWMCGWMDGCVGGWMDGWLEGCVDHFEDKSFILYVFVM